MTTNKIFSIRSLAKRIYHWVPLGLRTKLHIRKCLLPLLFALEKECNLITLIQKLSAMLFAPARKDTAWDSGRETALARILQIMAKHARIYGPLRHWIALPFLATGGAEMVALNLSRALRELRPKQSVLLLITDSKLIDERMTVPDGVLLLALDDYFWNEPSYPRKQALLRDLLTAVQPDVFHNINSEIAWHLILQEGSRLRKHTRLFASIFMFQFASDRYTKIGYAAYFLKQGMPYLSGLLSDNRRFLIDAASEYQFMSEEQSRMAVLYQPCRLLTHDQPDIGYAHLDKRRRMLNERSTQPPRRPQVLWAGRLDAQKRIDLFFDVVRHCTFADFRLFGQAVLDQAEALPVLSNLSYEGAFTSPLEWLERFDFDAFLFTSHWEGLPNVLLEVGILGIPVIAPTVGGIGELISDATGYPLPERATVSDYEQALQTIAENPMEALQRSERLHELILQRHSWDSFTASVSALTNYMSQPLANNHMDIACEPESPLVSVVIPCYNQGQYLHESVESVLSSCASPLEIIVIDDGSTDHAITRQLEEIKQIAPHIIHIHRQRNLGLSSARNSGVVLARGQYIQFLDADDVLTPGKIDAQIAQFQVNPDLEVAVCNFLLCDDARIQFSKKEEAIAQFDLSKRNFLYVWERGFAIPIHCGLFRRSVVKETPFDSDLFAKEDWLFWTSLAIKKIRFSYIGGHWAIYRQHQNSMRKSYLKMGRYWLEASIKINNKLAGEHPLFFDSAISWFMRYYYGSPVYREEIVRLKKMGCHPGMLLPNVVEKESAEAEIKKVADILLQALSHISDDPSPPLISVIIPVYNHFEELQACIESLGMQGNVSMEIICVDDASTDPRLSILMRTLQEKNKRLKIHIESSNRGISAVQNMAVTLASGKYIAFLDCDDRLETCALEMILHHLKDNPSTDYLFTDRTDIDKTGKKIRVARYGGYSWLHFSTQENIAADLMNAMVASHLKVIRRKSYLATGGCNSRWDGIQDWELALRMVREEYCFSYLPLALYQHRIHENSVTTKYSTSQFRKVNKVRRYYMASFRADITEESEVRIFTDLNVFSLDILKRSWQQGDICVADMRGEMRYEKIYFLREFNSYFDYLLWNDPRIPAALFGYLCNEIKLIQED